MSEIAAPERPSEDAPRKNDRRATDLKSFSLDETTFEPFWTDDGRTRWVSTDGRLTALRSLGRLTYRITVDAHQGQHEYADLRSAMATAIRRRLAADARHRLNLEATGDAT